MKNLRILLISIVAAAVAVPQIHVSAREKEPVQIKVMSYNIRNSKAKDGTNAWKYRFPATVLMLQDEHPDIFSVQEALEDQLYILEENLPEYKWIGVGREDGKREGECTAIFYDKKKLSVGKNGTFWLSEHPEKPSKGWDALCKRTATWALVTHKASKERFFFVNVHLDHVGKIARRKGLSLVLDRIASLNEKGYPVVIAGDFNVLPGNRCLQQLDTIMSCTRKIAAKTDDSCTYHDWGKKAEIKDYIYVSGFGNCPEYRTVTKKFGSWKFISDHYPIVSILEF